jgi:hypothetical protein
MQVGGRHCEKNGVFSTHEDPVGQQRVDVMPSPPHWEYLSVGH